MGSTAPRRQGLSSTTKTERQRLQGSFKNKRFLGLDQEQALGNELIIAEVRLRSLKWILKAAGNP